MKTTARLKKWGSSLGIVVPSEIVKQEHLEEGEEIVIEIESKKHLLEAFGFLKKHKEKHKLDFLTFRKQERQNEAAAEERHG